MDKTFYVADTYQDNATVTNGGSFAQAVRTCKWFNNCFKSTNGISNRFTVVGKFIKNPNLE